MIKKIASNITDFIISILDIDDGTRDIESEYRTV